MPQPIAVVDAFTAEPYHGNPAGICVLPAPASDEWMQSVAIEMNHAETAFLVKVRTGSEDGYDLRWFTPGGEVDLCGHATLASAHFLWETGALAAGKQARFHTRSGLLTADQLLPNGAAGDDAAWIELDFPAEPVSPAATPDGLAAMLGAEPVFVGRNRLDYLVELNDESIVRSLHPDLKQIATLSDAEDVRGIIVTATGTNNEADIVSRCFFPHFHIDEDPVTGSAHCGLAPYWIPRLRKQEIIAYQASARGGWLRLRLAGDRVKLRGQAVTTLCGELAHNPR
jgi:predicted PhzF superfamily epimerase YddE/YHI9